MNNNLTHYFSIAFIAYSSIAFCQNDWDTNTSGQITYINGNVGIGTTSPSTDLEIVSQASAQETPILLKVGDSNDFFKIFNATSSSGQFIPSLYGYHNSDNRQALYIAGAIDASNDMGGQPIMVFDSRIHGTSTVSNRPLFGWDSYGDRKMILNASGDLGLGTSTPKSKLHVHQVGSVSEQEILATFSVEDAASDYLEIKNATLQESQFIPNLYGYHGSDDRQALYITAAIPANQDIGSKPLMMFDARIHATGQTINRPLFGWDSYGVRKMTFTASGNLGIGTATPSHKLEVNGTIRSKEVKVEASPWPDYVFEPDYELESIESVEAFIQSNGHLPEIPSAAEMEANGVKLGEMNRLLLKKIEELTLYLIEANKEKEELSQRLNANSQRQEKKTEELTLYTIEQEKRLQEQDILKAQVNRLLERIEKLENNQK